jgi:AcrR family transcriptional regulator
MAKIVIKKPKKRKPGEKAGLSCEMIVAEAIILIEKNPALTLTGIAKALKVAPGAVYAHFPGKLSEILTEMVRTVLAGVARPFHPKESWEEYLRDLCVALSRTFHEHRNLALQVVSELSANYYLNPLLVERILLALSMAGLPDGERARALDLVMGNLIGFIAVECPALGSQSAAEWVESLSAAIDGLPAGEHPEIKALQNELSDVAAERAAQIDAAEPSPSRAQRFADHLIAGLKVQHSDVTP